MSELPTQQPVKPVEQTTVERSVSRDGAFSKPGTTSGKGAKSSSKGWRPAHGTRFRATNEKARGRPRKRPRDPRNVQFY